MQQQTWRGWLLGMVTGMLCALSAAHAAPPPADDEAGAPPAGRRNFLWQDVTHNLRDTDVLAIAVDPRDPRRVFLGTGGAIYRTQDGGRTWEERFALRDTGGAVRALLVTTSQPQRVYAGTERGLWVSDDHGTHWRRGGIAGTPCLALLQDPAKPEWLWVGTGQGLYASADGGGAWHVVGGPPARRRITALGRPPADAAALYVATEVELMRTTDDGRTWHSCVLARATGEASDTGAPSDDHTDEPHAPSGTITSIACDPQYPHAMVALVRNSALVSADRGRSWQALPTSGLPQEIMRSAVITPPPAASARRAEDALRPPPAAASAGGGVTQASASHLYVATDGGVWTFDAADRQWVAVYRGLTARQVRQLAVQPQDGSLWAATDRGVFHGAALPDRSDGPMSPLNVWALFQHEPAVDEVQRWAIRYSETDPAKIARWRRQAAAKALLPTLSLSVARNNTVNDHYDEGTYPKFQLIPTRDLDRNLGVSVSWDLSELIWNNDQTSIDTRSKLTTELRDSLVAEVTQLYFERRRLQTDMALQPSADPQRALQQALRVDELTAHINALTGGRFARALEGQER